MIAVKEISRGVFQRLSGNPVLDSLDGEVRAPLLTILAPSWTAEDRAKFGVYVVEPAPVPDGKIAVGAPRYECMDGAVTQVLELEDKKPPNPEEVFSIINMQRTALDPNAILIWGLVYPVMVSGDVVTIGCQVHTVAEWRAFTADEKAAMDGLKSARFLRDYLDPILKIAEQG